MIGLAIILTAMILISVSIGLGMLSEDTGDDFKPRFFAWLWHLFFGSVFLLILGVWLTTFGL